MGKKMVQRSCTIMDRIELLYNRWVNGIEFIDDLYYRFVSELRECAQLRECDANEIIDGVRVWYGSQKFPPDRDFIEFVNNCAESIGSPTIEFDED